MCVTCVFDEVEVYEKIPSDLSIDAEKAKGIVKEHAKSILANSLVQAIALLRQKNHDGVMPLYCVYLKSIPKLEKFALLQYLLCICYVIASILRTFFNS
ncbi:protein TIC110, chloroplastic-like [Zingiber officinale]|uniref:protein TIC110, chloroplastic-like n=1 Tax=Zingiber officinale TaxID=94328 RepID=UPI001C4CDE62|nr:protein TIC110, chloroplastic-like [Zingiber officinale]